MKCAACQCYRSKLHTCAMCAKKPCGCCSFKTKDGKRVCCYPDDAGCHAAYRQKLNDVVMRVERLAKERDFAAQMDTALLSSQPARVKGEKVGGIRI